MSRREQRYLSMKSTIDTKSGNDQEVYDCESTLRLYSKRTEIPHILEHPRPRVHVDSFTLEKNGTPCLRSRYLPAYVVSNYKLSTNHAFCTRVKIAKTPGYPFANHTNSRCAKSASAADTRLEPLHGHPPRSSSTIFCCSAHHFLDAPKFVRFLFACESFSLSSLSFSFFFSLLAFFPAVADVGVAFADPVSLKDVDNGVGACDPGVEPPDAPGSYQVVSLRCAMYERRICPYWFVLITYTIAWPVGNRRPRKDAVLLRRPCFASLRGSASHALHVVVETSDDVTIRRALQIHRLLRRYALLDLGLLTAGGQQNFSEERASRHPRRDSPNASQAACASRPAPERGLGTSCTRPLWVAPR